MVANDSILKAIATQCLITEWQLLLVNYIYCFKFFLLIEFEAILCCHQTA